MRQRPPQPFLPLRPLLFCLGGFVLAAPPVWAENPPTTRPALQQNLPDGVFYPKSFTLENGLQVIVIPMNRAPVVNHMIWYRVGAADDPRGKSGIAHFLEHLMFKGTPKVPDGQFSKIVARLGGEENAFTSYDITAFFQSVPKEYLGKMMEMEADRMVNLTLDPQVVLSERDVIRAERGQTIDQKPNRRLGEMMDAALLAGTPYATPVIGWDKDMAGLSREDALAFYQRWYAPNNATLIVAGDVTLDEVRPLAEKYYGPLISRTVPDPIRHDNPPPAFKTTITLRDEQLKDPIFIRASIAPDSVDKPGNEYYALGILGEILSGGKSSVLYRRLVQEERLANFIDFSINDNLIGVTEISFSGEPATGVPIEKLEAALNREIDAFLKKGISDQELFDAKERSLASAIYARDSLSAPSRVFAFALSQGNSIEDIEQWPRRVAAVTKEQVIAIAHQVLKPEYGITGYLLPTADAKKTDAKPSTTKGMKK